MSDERDKSLDILGIRPVAKAVENVSEKSLQAAGTFLSLICRPALEEFGGLLGDKVRTWRLLNLVKILDKAKGKLEYNYDNDSLKLLKISPRVALPILEHGSMNDNDEVQEMWAGLLASSCSKKGDDENLIFVSLLEQLTNSQARILKYISENTDKKIDNRGLIYVDVPIRIEAKELDDVTGISDIHRLDRELDHMRSLQIVEGGFNIGDEALAVEVMPTALGLHLFVRCQGFVGSPYEYWKLTYKDMNKKPHIHSDSCVTRQVKIRAVEKEVEEIDETGARVFKKILFPEAPLPENAIEAKSDGLYYTVKIWDCEGKGG